MGLSDEMYALAIERMHEEQRMEVLRAQLDVEAKRIKATPPTVGGHPYNTKIGEPRMVTADLDHEAAKVSIDTLKDMWIMRFQDNWVEVDVLKEDDFWRIAFVRLENVNRLERHMLFDKMQYVYRIIE